MAGRFRELFYKQSPQIGDLNGVRLPERGFHFNKHLHFLISPAQNRLSFKALMQEMTAFVFPDGLSPEEIQFAKHIVEKPRQFVDHPDLHQPNAHIVLFKNELDLRDAELAWHAMLVKDITYIPRNIKKLMTKEEEKEAFLQYNYARMRVVQVCNSFKNNELNTEQVRDMLLWHQIAKKMETTLVTANMGLIFSALRNNHIPIDNNDDYFSDCQFSLLKSIKGFDVELGWKFSTYCWNAIKRQIWRTSKLRKKEWLEYRSMTLDGNTLLEGMVENSVISPKNDDIDELKMILQENLACLTPRERNILNHRFGLNERSKTLEEVGVLLGKTKERIRQVQNEALSKLRCFYSTRSA